MDLAINILLTNNGVKSLITEGIFNSRGVAASCIQAGTSTFDRGSARSEVVP
jgi:hypothetical protein